MVDARRLAEEIRCLAAGLVAALLPAPENRRLGRAWGVDVGPYSMLLGLIEAVVGGLGFLFGAIAAMHGHILFLNMVLLENWFEGLSTAHFQGGGLLALLIWCTHPLAILLAVQGITGMVRIFTFVTTQDPVGEPSVWILLRLFGLVARGLGRASRTRRLGPLRPDRLVWGRDGADLTILTCRDRAEWSDSITLEVEGRFFRLDEVVDRVEGAYHVLAHRFSELGEHTVVRRPVAYRDTAEVYRPPQPSAPGRRS